MARDPGKLSDRPWSDDAEVAVADVMDESAVRRALEGVDVAYYLIHSLGTGASFERRDRSATIRSSQVTVEQLSQDILVRQCVGFGGVRVFRGRTAFRCPGALVLIGRHHHGLTAKGKAYEIVPAAMPSRLCAHRLQLRACSDVRDGHRGRRV